MAGRSIEASSNRQRKGDGDMTDDMAGLDWADRMRVAHFDDLIRGARANAFLDDVEHWTTKRADFIRERRATHRPPVQESTEGNGDANRR